MFVGADLSVLDNLPLIPTDPNIINDQVSEIHIYSFYGDYISGNHDAGYVLLEKTTNSLLVDVGTVFKEAGINRGSYRTVLNLFQSVWGQYNDEKTIVKEISPDRTEIRFQVPTKFITEYLQFQSRVQELSNQDILNGLVVNFGFNQIQKIVNIRFDNEEFYVKFYQPIVDDIVEKDKAWFQFEVIDPYIDTVILASPLSQGNVTYMKGPNFNLDTTQFTSNATTFKTWNDLLDANLPTQQRIIDQSISGSGLVRLNLDFTSFENFVFYSSAEERLRNFHYKLGKVEEYSSSIATLLNSTASNTIFISGSIDINQKRIDEITTNFDQWERWLYYENTSSLFTHDISGSITPYPKRIISGSWVIHNTSSSIATNWYNNLLVSSSAYDKDNQNRLWWAIPEHILMDEGNADFVLFVDMVGQHFDVLYTYIKALTQIHERDESPQRGVSNDLLWYIGKSFGWNLQNTRQLADLWKYKLGTNSSGSFASTGSMFSLSHENQTNQIWRRIVNNLPYLLKTKGTQRSVKALLSIYGIPQTLISIKEYGGPSPSTDKPSLIEDRFLYKLWLTGSQYIELNRRVVPVSSGSWNGITRTPDTIEFRFNTEYSASVSQSLWAIEHSGSRSTILSNLELVHIRAATGTSSYSGSTAYGFLRLTQAQLSGSVFISSSVQTGYLPLFDDDSWSIRLYTSESLVDTKKSGSIALEVKRAHDCLYGRISHSSSLSWSGSFNVAAAWGGLSGSANTPHFIVLGGTTGSRSTRFIGNIDSYKEYFEVINGTTFEHHVLNPSAYHGNNPTSSYYTLYRYYPLGLDQQRFNHLTYTNVSSSQPNRRASFDTTASFKNFTGNQTNQYTSWNETFYVYTPSLGGNLLRSEKIRLESSTLARDLSPTSRGERGAFDKAGFDTNRLAIVFSPTDQVNNEIYNHTGFAELDQYIADPDREYENEYPDLKWFAHQYYQKYQQRTDINALIRILALYDYTFFEQIKQVIPGRADAILGILIEDDVLHRNKVQLTKRPTIENPQYEATIPRTIPSQSGDYQNLEGSASFKPIIESRYKYITGSIQQPLFVTGSSLSHRNTGSRDYLGDTIDTIPTRYSGSQAPTQSYIPNQRLNCCYKKVIYHYSSSGQFSTKYERQWYTAVSMSYNWYYSRSLECTSYMNLEGCSAENKSRFQGSKLEGPGININAPGVTVDGGPVVTIWESNPSQLKIGESPLGGNLIVV